MMSAGVNTPSHRVQPVERKIAPEQHGIRLVNLVPRGYVSSSKINSKRGRAEGQPERADRRALIASAFTKAHQ